MIHATATAVRYKSTTVLVDTVVSERKRKEKERKREKERERERGREREREREKGMRKRIELLQT